MWSFQVIITSTSYFIHYLRNRDGTAFSFFSFDVLAFRIKNMTDCWRPSNHTKQQKFWMTFLGRNYHNPQYISKVTFDRWEIHGFISCLFPTYFLSVSAIIEYFHYGFLLNGTDALIFGRDVEVFWFKGVKNINCSDSCCVPSLCDFNYGNHWSEYVHLLNQTLISCKG